MRWTPDADFSWECGLVQDFSNSCAPPTIIFYWPSASWIDSSRHRFPSTFFCNEKVGIRLHTLPHLQHGLSRISLTLQLKENKPLHQLCSWRQYLPQFLWELLEICIDNPIPWLSPCRMAPCTQGLQNRAVHSTFGRVQLPLQEGCWGMSGFTSRLGYWKHAVFSPLHLAVKLLLRKPVPQILHFHFSAGWSMSWKWADGRWWRNPAWKKLITNSI